MTDDLRPLRDLLSGETLLRRAAELQAGADYNVGWTVKERNEFIEIVDGLDFGRLRAALATPPAPTECPCWRYWGSDGRCVECGRALSFVHPVTGMGYAADEVAILPVDDDRDEDDSDRSGVESDSEYYARARYLAGSATLAPTEDATLDAEWLTTEVVAYFKLYDHGDIWRESRARALAEWLKVRSARVSAPITESALAEALHAEFWDDSVPREEGEACCMPSARRILAALKEQP